MLVKESKTYLMVFALAVFVVGGYSLYQDQSDQESMLPITNTKMDAGIVTSVSRVPSSEASIPEIPQLLSNATSQEHTDIQDLINQLASRLISDHAHEIHDLAFQVTLKDLREDLVLDHSQQGPVIFEKVLRQAFPSLVDSILALLVKKDLYDNWLLGKMIDLNKMSLADQKEMLWTKRYEIFGKEDAEKIWEPERDENEERSEAVHTVLNMLNQSEDVAMHDRIYLLKAAYEENFFGTVEDLVLDSSGVLAQTIFSMDVVQKELAVMKPEARQSEINSVRRQLGFDEAQISWLAQRDQEREKRWENGYAYMNERAGMDTLYQGEELERNLDLLREKYFQDEAATIKKEEELIGFFRYTRQRVYGRN
jgi:hypothetical protein